MDLKREIEKATALLTGARQVVTFSGAGMSAESGIPTFRDPGGIWDQFDPEEIGTGPGLLNTLARMPDKIRSFLENTIRVFFEARPNAGHLALATLEQMKVLSHVITQNVDNLHQEAGNRNVIEMHGNLYRQRCLACEAKRELSKQELLGEVGGSLSALEEFSLPAILRALPRCTCGSPMRPDVVMFGEAVQGIQEAFQAAESCSVMLVLGTSGVVYPAAALPQRAKQAGASVIEINPGESSYRGLADVRIPTSTAEALPRIVEMLRHA